MTYTCPPSTALLSLQNALIGELVHCSEGMDALDKVCWTACSLASATRC